MPSWTPDQQLAIDTEGKNIIVSVKNILFTLPVITSGFFSLNMFLANNNNKRINILIIKPTLTFNIVIIVPINIKISLKLKTTFLFLLIQLVYLSFL